MEHDKLSSDVWKDQNLSESKNEENVEAVLDFALVTSNGTVSENDKVAEVNVSDTVYEGNSSFISTSIKDIYNSNASLPEDMRFNSGHIISICGYGSLFMVSSVANFLVLKILIARYRKTKSRVNLLLCHLAIADLLVTFMMMPLEIGWSATVMWHAGDFLCRFFSFFRIFGLFLSSNVLICISLDRFYAIVCPLSSGKAVRNMKFLLASAWIISILCASPQMFIFHVKNHPLHTWYSQCVTIWLGKDDSPWQLAYLIFGMVMTFFWPLMVIVLTYGAILLTIYKKSKECETDVGLRRSGAGVLNRARARTLKMTIVIVLVFIFCWTPYYIVVLWFLSDKESFNNADFKFKRLLYIFACANSFMNPLVYGFFNLRQSRQSPNTRNMTTHPTIADSACHTNIPMTTCMHMQRNQTVARLNRQEEASTLNSHHTVRSDSRKVSV